MTSPSIFTMDLHVQIEGGSASDPAVVRPCVAALGRLTSDFFKDLSLSVQVYLH